MSQLPKEWEAIVSELGAAMPRKIVERCYALTQKPQRELTDAEMLTYYNKGAFDAPPNHQHISGLRALVAAHQRKQAEPEKLKFRAVRFKTDHTVVKMILAEAHLSDYWEWLEPAQEYEVTLP